MQRKKKVSPLGLPDLHFQNAAEGWLMLGNTEEALAELDRISEPNQTHPEVLELKWALHASRKEWNLCVEIGERLVTAAPHQPSGWIHRSYALHELKRTAEAWELLLPAAGKFKNNVTIPYNLACYACQLEKIDQARLFLRCALALGNKNETKAMALKDPDLQPLHSEIRDL